MRRFKDRAEMEVEATRAVLWMMSRVHGNVPDRSLPIPDYDRIFAAVERREPFTPQRLMANLAITRQVAASVFGKADLQSHDFPFCLKHTFCNARTYAFQMPETPWAEKWYTIRQAEDIYHLCTGWCTYHIRQAIADKRLPAYRFSTRCTRLLRQDIIDYISRRIAAHNAKQPVGHRKGKRCIDSVSLEAYENESTPL